MPQARLTKKTQVILLSQVSRRVCAPDPMVPPPCPPPSPSCNRPMCSCCYLVGHLVKKTSNLESKTLGLPT